MKRPGAADKPQPNDETVAATARITLPMHGEPGHLIRRLNQIATAVLVEELHRVDIDLTPVQYAALSTVAALPRIDQAALSDVIAIDRATVGGVIDRLEAKGLLRRVASSADRRLKQLLVESDGAEVLARAEAAVARSQQRILAPLAESDRSVMVKLLDKLVLNAEPPPALQRAVTARVVERAAPPPPRRRQGKP